MVITGGLTLPSISVDQAYNQYITWKKNAPFAIYDKIAAAQGKIRDDTFRTTRQNLINERDQVLVQKLQTQNTFYQPVYHLSENVNPQFKVSYISFSSNGTNFIAWPASLKSESFRSQRLSCARVGL